MSLGLRFRVFDLVELLVKGGALSILVVVGANDRLLGLVGLFVDNLNVTRFAVVNHLGLFIREGLVDGVHAEE